MKYPPAFERVVTCLSRFQGIGRKTAERLVFDILTRWDEKAIVEFSEALAGLCSGVIICPVCRVHVESHPCPFCTKERLATKQMCVVATSRDAYAIEATGVFPGCFYVLGGMLSPLDDRGVCPAVMQRLKARVCDEQITEVVFAFDSSLEGDVTASYLRDELEPLGVELSRIAAGVPVGAALEYIDKSTLSRAFKGRQKVGTAAPISSL